VLDQALAQIPDHHRHGHPILVRVDTAGASKASLAHVASLREHGVDAEFSIGWRTDRLHELIHATPRRAWSAAIDTGGDPDLSAQVAELTGLMPAAMPADYPEGHAGDRAPRTTTPRCTAEPVRRARWLALHRLRDALSRARSEVVARQRY